MATVPPGRRRIQAACPQDHLGRTFACPHHVWLASDRLVAPGRGGIAPSGFAVCHTCRQSRPSLVDHVISQDPNAQVNVSAVPRWFRLPPSPNDTARKLWTGEMLHIDFGFPPDERRGGRELKEGYLPVLRTWWQDGPLYYEATTVLDSLEGDLGSIALDSPTVLLMRIHVANTSDRERTTARLLVTSRGDGRPSRSLLTVSVPLPAMARCRSCAVSSMRRAKERRAPKGRGSLVPRTGARRIPQPLCRRPLDHLEGRRAAHRVACASAISTRLVERVCGFWRAIARREAAGIVTPEPWLNDFYAAHARHLLGQLLQGDRLRSSPRPRRDVPLRRLSDTSRP